MCGRAGARPEGRCGRGSAELVYPRRVRNSPHDQERRSAGSRSFLRCTPGGPPRPTAMTDPISRSISPSALVRTFLPASHGPGLSALSFGQFLAGTVCRSLSAVPVSGGRNQETRLPPNGQVPRLPVRSSSMVPLLLHRSPDCTCLISEISRQNGNAPARRAVIAPALTPAGFLCPHMS